MPRIGIMIGSDSDLSQCAQGFNILKSAEAHGHARVVAVITNSIHRNLYDVLQNLRALTCPKRGEQGEAWVNAWVIGAGWANHLTGICESYLRYNLQNDFVPVFGVAFQSDDPDKTLAAILSIEAVPGFQGVFDRHRHVGSLGFANACLDAVYGDFPEIKLSSPKPVWVRDLKNAIIAADTTAKK